MKDDVHVTDLPPDEAEDLVLDPTDPMPSALAIVRASFTGEQGRTLHRHREAFWKYDGSCYRIATDETVDGEIWTFLDLAKARTRNGVDRFKPSRSRVGDVRAALAAACMIDEYIEPPAWLTSDRGDASEFFACGNGLLHVPTGQLHPATSDYFGVSASDVCFDPNAPVPEQWLAYLDQVLGNAKAIETLQEWMGYMLTPDTSQQKILFCVGPKRSGKGTFARITTAVLGKLSVAGPTMSQLGETFGIESLITKPLAIISDARIGGRTDKSVIVERLLSISGEDTMTVNRKHTSAWTGRLPTRFVIMTNELPALTEGSGALIGRFIMLIFPKTFFGKEDLALEAKLKTELPGILNWAIVGYRRLRERGHFVQPKNAEEKLEEMEMLGAPVKAFLRDRCKVGPKLEADADELFKAWQNWNEDNGVSGQRAGSKPWFGRNLRSALPGMKTKREGKGRDKVYVGLCLLPKEPETF